MKKQSTKSMSKKQVRRKRSKRRVDEAPIDEVISFQAGIREALVSQIRDAVTAMAEDLVLSEAEELLGARWSRKPDSTLRRGGYTNSRIFVAHAACA